MAWFKHHPASLIKCKSSWKEAGGFMSRYGTGERLGEYLWVTSRNSTRLYASLLLYPQVSALEISSLQMLMGWKIFWFGRILLTSEFWGVGKRDSKYVFAHIYHTVCMHACFYSLRFMSVTFLRTFALIISLPPVLTKSLESRRQAINAYSFVLFSSLLLSTSLCKASC